MPVPKTIERNHGNRTYQIEAESGYQHCVSSTPIKLVLPFDSRTMGSAPESEQKMSIPDSGFPVDDCFGRGVGRPPLDGLTTLDMAANAGEMVTFEEFIRGGSKRRIAERGPEDLRPIDEDDPADEFFNIALDTARVADNPFTADQRGKGIRSKLYTMHSLQEDSSADRGRTQPSGSLSGASFRQSFCPTVGEGARWLGVGGPRKQSQDSAAYEPPEDPGTVAKMPRMETPANVRSNARGSTSFDSLRNCQDRIGDDQGHLVLQRRSHSHSNGGNLLLSKFFCCFRAVDPNGQHVGRYEGEQRTAEQQQPRPYSWDVRQQPTKPDDLVWRGLVGETRVKESGQLNGNPFQIEGCSNCTLVLLDHSASVTVDDCRDCVILCGPSRGSIFLRDCTNLLLLAICQQFRTRDCRQLSAHLFCATCPTIEETDMNVAPLLLYYPGLQVQMRAAELSPFVNRWNKVHNFTPETGKFHVIRNVSLTANASNTALVQQLNMFLSTAQVTLSIGKRTESCLFVDGLGRGAENEQEKAFVLIQPNEGIGLPGMRYYSEAIELTQQLLTHPGTELAAMHDIDLRPGEWETIVHQKNQKIGAVGKQKKKIICIEICGPSGTLEHASNVCCRMEMKAMTVELVEDRLAEHYRKHLYRLCEIRQNI